MDDSSAAAGSGNPFWDFSVALYGRPGVHEACLALQQRLGLDVNLLLYAVWIGWRGGGRLDGAALDRARASVETWHRTVVEPLWAAQRALKETPFPGVAAARAAALRAAVVQAELDAERVTQDLLHAQAPAPPHRPETDPERRRADAAANARLYLAGYGDDGSDLEPVLAALIPR
ncbi:MAG: TIGR02444 family protein [Hyphomicrobiales bacterium]|nr:TIGR02444 family protein [Hyphomicrobiales bacterium]